MARLGDYIEQIRGVSYKPEDICSSTDNGAVAVLRANNIQDDGLNFDDLIYIKRSKISDKQYIQEGDIVVCASSGSKSLVGKAAIADKKYPVSFGAFCKVVRPKKLLPRYIGYFFQSPKYRSTISESSGGANINNIRNEHIDELDIVIVSEKEQEHITSELDALCNLVSLRKQQLSKLDELVKSRFIELFGDLHSTKFPKCKMAEICNIKHGYAFSGEFFTEEDNNILLVTPGNFKVGGGFQEKKCKFFMGEYSEEYVLNCGDLIVTMTDLSKNMDTLGYSAIVPSTNRVYLHNQRIGLFVDMSENINKVFLMYFMQTNEYRDSIITSATGSTVHHTSPSKILDCDVFLPPIELQDQFAAFVEQTDKSKLIIQQSLEKLETLKKALMQKYFG